MNDIINNFEEFEEPQEFSTLKTDNLIFEIWVKPRLVFAYLFKYDPSKYVQILLVISALTTAFERNLSRNIGWHDSYNTSYFIGVCLGGGLMVYVIYYVSAWFLHFFGKAFLNGQANPKDFRTVIAWANIPSIASAIFSFIILVIYGSKALSDSYLPISGIERIVFISFAIIQVTLAIWALIITIIGVKEIQKFSTVKALGNILLPFIILIVVVLIIFLIGDLF
ncbi:MAG: YIP1 family protein [Flavobacteriales bacterium]